MESGGGEGRGQGGREGGMVMSVQFNAGGAVGRFGGGGGGGHLSVGRSGGLSKFALHPMH